MFFPLDVLQTPKVSISDAKKKKAKPRQQNGRFSRSFFFSFLVVEKVKKERERVLTVTKKKKLSFLLLLIIHAHARAATKHRVDIRHLEQLLIQLLVRVKEVFLEIHRRLRYPLEARGVGRDGEARC